MKRPQTSQKVIDLISELVDSQDKKGLEKYGVTIDTASDYEWNVMALEEMVDGMKYMVKENEYLNKRLREFNKKTWFPVYEENLRLAEDNKRMHKHITEIDSMRASLVTDNTRLVKQCENLDVILRLHVKDNEDLKEENERLKRSLKAFEYSVLNLITKLDQNS